MNRILLTVAFVSASAVLAVVQSGPEQAMSAAAKALLATLDDGQRAKIRFPMEAEERFNWHFIPRDRQGLPLKMMTPPQRDAAFALLKTGLSEKGFTKAETIRSLEIILKALENGAARRDTELYYFTIFGEPGADKWGWRYEGHHIAQNWTIVRGKPTATSPAFFGTNPAVVLDGPTKGQRALPLEGDLAFELLGSLSDDQRRQAIVGEKAPNDIITTNTRKAAIADNVGLPMSAMTDKQRATLRRLVDEHASAQAAALAAHRISKARGEKPDDVKFAWMGSTQPGLGNGHYYRIQGKTFLIEYDNVQNNANHQHVVWRDFTGDFGDDVLAQHYAADPAHAGVAHAQAAEK
jgi:Protein of unknown function (DUF3500)